MPCRLMAASPPRETSRVVAMPDDEGGDHGEAKARIGLGSSTAATGVRARVPKKSTGSARKALEGIERRGRLGPQYAPAASQIARQDDAEDGKKATLRMACTGLPIAVASNLLRI